MLHRVQEKNIDKKTSDIEQQKNVISKLKYECLPKLSVQECFLDHRFQKEEVKDTLEERNALEGQLEKHSFEIDRLRKSKEDATDQKTKYEEDVNRHQDNLTQAHTEIINSEESLRQTLQQLVALLPNPQPFESTPQVVKSVLDIEQANDKSDLKISANDIVEAESDKTAKKEAADESSKQFRYAEKDWQKENSIGKASEEEDKYKDEDVKKSCQLDYYKLIDFIKAVGREDIRRLMHGQSALLLSFYTIKKTQVKNIVGLLRKSPQIWSFGSSPTS